MKSPAKFWGIRVASVVLALAGAYAAQSAVLGMNNSFVSLLFVLAGLYVTLAVSLNLINGITGQFSMGHAAFYMIGAYTAALVTKLAWKSQMAPMGWVLIMVVVGALAAALAGLLVGIPSLRLRGDYLAVVTLGFGEIVKIIAKNQEVLGKAYGMNNPLKFQSIFLVFLLAILCIAVCRNLLKTAHGLSFLAVREDEIASAAMGVNLTKIKVSAFVLGSAFAGAAGALYSHGIQFISPESFSMDMSFLIVTMVVLGGTGSITGTSIAAVVLFLIPEKLRDLSNVKMGMIVGIGIALIITVALIKRAQDHYHKSSPPKSVVVIGLTIAGLILAAGLGAALANIPALAVEVAGSKLRTVMLAVTLVVLMLLRPQGIFGHHEFSWSWVQKLFGKKDVPNVEVAA